MHNLTGLFIEDDVNNIKIYSRLFETEGLKLESFDKLPDDIKDYYDIILEKKIDFLVIDYHLEKQVPYKGIDVLKEIRKHDSTIYTVLLTNYELKEFLPFSEYDYEINKSELISRYKDITEKIKRACDLRRENMIYKSVELKHHQDDETIRLLREINSKLDQENN